MTPPHKPDRPPTIRDLLRPHVDRLGQSAVARLAGVPQPNLSDWLAGKAEIRTDTAERLARACGHAFRLVRAPPPPRPRPPRKKTRPA